MEKKSCKNIHFAALCKNIRKIRFSTKMLFFVKLFRKLEMCRCDTDAPAGIAKLEYGTC